MLYFLFNFDTERRVFFIKVLGEIWGGLGGLMAVLIPLLLEQAYCTTRGSFALRELPLGRSLGSVRLCGNCVDGLVY